MSYAYERPDLKTVDELETLVRHLLDELATWRRRCLKAEADLQREREAAGTAGPGGEGVRDRVVSLESENQALRQRVDSARERVQALLSRLEFLEEQAGGAA